MRICPVLSLVAAIVGACAARPAQAAAQAVRFHSVSAGSASMNCALATDGRAWCWGTRADWSRGRRVPATAVLGAVRFLSFTTIQNAACGLGTDSLAYCIGENWWGILGDGSPANDADGTYRRARPGAVAGGRALRWVSGGGDAACGSGATGQLWCWGSNQSGVFGNGAAVAQYDSRTGYGGNVPVASGSNGRFVTVSVGFDHACGLDDEGVAWCWGQNGSGQLGDGTTQAHLMPQPVDGHGFRQIATGMRTTCGVTQEGAALCWGANAGPTPTPVPGGMRWTVVATARDMACGVAEDGAAWCWGSGVDGMLGTGALGERDQFGIHYLRADAPARVSGGVRFQSVSIGGYSVCGVSVDGDVWCWGRNDYGQLGVPLASSPGGVDRSATPVKVPVRGGAP